MSEPKVVTAAVAISLVAGILIILGNPYASIGLVSGILVVLFAIMLKVRPGEGTQGLRACCIWWGGAILVSSVVGFLGGPMGCIGAVLGIVGGALALIHGLGMR